MVVPALPQSILKIVLRPAPSGGNVFVHGPPGNQRAQHAFEAGAVERRVLRARAQGLGVAHPRHVGIDDDQVGRRARGEAPDFEAEDFRRSRRQRPEEGEHPVTSPE